METLGIIAAFTFIGFVAWGLKRGQHPQLILLAAGCAMFILGWAFGHVPEPKNPTGWPGFDVFQILSESIKSKLAGIGAMIMTIAGFVAYMDHMGATESLVQLATRPIQWLRKFPLVAATFVLPLGQVLSLCVPSAAGLGLLMVASVHPLLLRLGIRPLASISIITLCTCFDMGPASANTARASELLAMDNVTYFLGHQLPWAAGLNVIIMAVVYLQLRRDGQAPPSETTAESVHAQAQLNSQANPPRLFAFFPVLPLVLLMVFSAFFQDVESGIVLNTTTAMWIALAIAMLAHGAHQRAWPPLEEGLKSCWQGMGNSFRSVVSLIIAADLFAKGLIQLGLIDALIEGAQWMGAGGWLMLVLFSALILLASVLMGSGNATFFAFGPLVPELAARFGWSGVRFLLPMQLASSMGRAASPIAGVVIATAGIAGVSAIDVAKRNAIPMGITWAAMALGSGIWA